MARLYVQAQKFQIAGSGVSSSATSITLVSFKITKPDGSTRLITMSDFGDLGLIVLEPGVSRKEETISFTGVTQNGDGSATLTGVTRGITPFSPYGSDSSYTSAHSGFVTAILSNPAKMYSNFIGPSDNIAVTGLWTFPYPTSASHSATKQYVDDVLVGTMGTATDTTAGSTRVTKNQSTKPRAQSTYVREQNTPDMTLKVESFKLAFIDSTVTFAGGNSPAFINPGLGGDLGIVSNPSNSETVTLTINGTVCTFTFVTAIGATPGNILIQGTASATRAALATFIANPGTTNANQVAFTGAQLTAMGLVSSTDDLSANLFIRANSSTVTTFTGAETMAGGSNIWTANTTKNRLDLLVVNGGSLAIRKGSEAVTPTVPTPTTGDTVLCSVYNIPGETVIRDKTAALSGYIDEWYDLSIYRTDLARSSTISFFGDGSNGVGVADGTTSIAGIAPSTSIYTLTKDVYFTDLTISTGVTIRPNGYKIYCTGTLTMNGTAKIERNGNAGGNGGNGGIGVTGTGGTAGAALAAGSLIGSEAGAAGQVSLQTGGAANNGIPGNPGNNVSNSLGGNGVSGGASNGGSGGSSGGSGGTATAANIKLMPGWSLQYLLDITSTGATVKYTNSAGAGGGASGGAQAVAGANGGGGGGGGSAGGIIAIFAKIIIIGASASITAIGGVGGNGGSGANGTGGGGGGGNGGIVIMAYYSLTNSGTITLTGGNGGTGGTAGTNGTTGTSYLFQL